MIKTDKHIKAIQLRDKYKKLINTIVEEQFKKFPDTPEKRVFPIYLANWRERLLKLEYYIIDCKYSNFSGVKN